MRCELLCLASDPFERLSERPRLETCGRRLAPGSFDSPLTFRCSSTELHFLSDLVLTEHSSSNRTFKGLSGPSGIRSNSISLAFPKGSASRSACASGRDSWHWARVRGVPREAWPLLRSCDSIFLFMMALSGVPERSVSCGGRISG